MLIQLEKIGKLRDSFLVLAAMLYGSGYLAWSYYAWRNNLGFLPALDLQYFIAGIVPFLIFGFIYWSITSGRKFIAQFRTNIGPEATGKFRITRVVMFFLYFIFAACIVFNSFIKAYTDEDTAAVIFIVAFFLLFLWILFSPSDFNSLSRKSEQVEAPKNETRLNQFIYNVLFYYILIAISIISLFFYLEAVYPSIPQELGGVKAKSAILEINRSSLSNQSLHEEWPDLSINNLSSDSRSDVIRTDTIDVLYNGSEKILFTCYHMRPCGVRTFEIPRDQINYIIWLPD